MYCDDFQAGMIEIKGRNMEEMCFSYLYNATMLARRHKRKGDWV